MKAITKNNLEAGAGEQSSMSTVARRLLSKKLTIIIAIIAGVLLVGSLFWIMNKQSTVDLSSVDYVVNRAGKLIVLPDNERPALVTVTDSTKVTTDFLKQAINGDKVLIYQKNKKAIIYRPSINKVIDVGPVLIDTPRKESTTDPSQ